MNQTSSLSISSTQMIALGLLLTLLLIPIPGLAFNNLQEYLTAFKDKHVDVRRGAIEQLLDCLAEEKDCLEGGNSDAFRQLVTAIIELLDDPDPKVREAAILYLKQSMDARVIKPIARLLRDENDDVRAAAVESFYLMKVDGVTVRELERLLTDKNKRVRLGAVSSLGLSGTKKSVGLLRIALTHETDQDARGLYTQTIQELEKRLAAKSPQDRK